MGFCLYVASGVFIQDQRTNENNSQSRTNLEFLLSAMRALGSKHSIVQHFTAQVELDIESSGINKRHSPSLGADGNEFQNMIGILPGRSGASTADACDFIVSSNKPKASATAMAHRPMGILLSEDPSPSPQNGYFGAMPLGILHDRSGDPSPQESPNATVINNFAAKMPTGNLLAHSPLGQTR